MGKEGNGQQRGIEYFTSYSTYADKQYIHWIITQQWSNSILIPNANDITEDNNVIITIKTYNKETNFNCNGVKRFKNSYTQLMKTLRSQNYLPKHQGLLRFFVKRNFMWEKINEKNDFFNAEDKILIIVQKNKRKCIKKSSKISK